MRKVFVFILACFYLTSATGATVHLHYCMNKLVDWKLWHSNEKKCSGCGMEKSLENDNGCCKDEHKQVKLENDHKAAPNYWITNLEITTFSSSELEIMDFNFRNAAQQIPLSHAPPRTAGTAVYILNRVFRI